MTTILRAARIVGGADYPVDVTITDGRIAEIGAASLDSPSAAEVVELGGRWLMPGLWDHHVHLGQVAIHRTRVDVAGAASAAEVVDTLRRHAAEHPPAAGRVMVAVGFRDGLWPDTPTLEGLDAAGAPVSIISGDVHAVWSNRAALSLLGLPESHWFLREQPAFDLNGRLSILPDDELDAAAADAVRAAAQRGIVGLVDLDMADAGAAWLRRRAAGAPRVRIRAAVYPSALDAARARGQRTGELIEGTEGLVVGGPYKLFADGALNTRTAWCDDPYPGHGSGADFGLATHEADELLHLAREGLAAGIIPTIHAIGDAAVTLALDTFAALGRGGSIEHAQLVRADDLPRFAALGVEASVQPEHAMDDRDVADLHWAGRTDRAFAYRSLLDAGATLRLGSDAPVAPLDPWITMAAAVTRSRDGREAWHPEQRLTPSEALAASTHTRVERGALADLVVVEHDPLEPGGRGLREMPVAGTMLAGEWLFGDLAR